MVEIRKGFRLCDNGLPPDYKIVAMTLWKETVVVAIDCGVYLYDTEDDIFRPISFEIPE